MVFQLPFWYLKTFNPGVNRVYYKEDSNITILEFKITSYNYKYKITSDMNVETDIITSIIKSL